MKIYNSQVLFKKGKKTENFGTFWENCDFRKANGFSSFDKKEFGQTRFYCNIITEEYYTVSLDNETFLNGIYIKPQHYSI